LLYVAFIVDWID